MSEKNTSFDCVDLKILLEKLFYFGVKGTPLKLLASYLDNRFQCTKIRDTKYSFLNKHVEFPRICCWAFTILYILMTS